MMTTPSTDSFDRAQRQGLRDRRKLPQLVPSDAAAGKVPFRKLVAVHGRHVKVAGATHRPPHA